MYVEDEIDAAVYCLRKEYGSEVDEAFIDGVVAGIRRHHRDAAIKSITTFLSKVGNGLHAMLTSAFGGVTHQVKRG